MTCEDEKLTPRQRLRCLLAEAVLTLTAYVVVAAVLVVLMAFYGAYSGIFLDKSATVKFLYWSGVGIASGTTVSASSMLAFFLRRMMARPKR